MGGVEGPRLAGNRRATCDGVDGRMDGWMAEEGFVKSSVWR